jgi:hypothetical protein
VVEVGACAVAVSKSMNTSSSSMKAEGRSVYIGSRSMNAMLYEG